MFETHRGRPLYNPWSTADLLSDLPDMALTSDLSIRFLRPAIGETVYARAVLNRANRRTVIGTVTVWTDDNEAEPCATGQGTYVLPG